MHTHRSLHNWGWLRLNEKLLVVSSAQFPRSVNIIACRSSKFLQVHGKSQRTYLAGHVRWPLILLLYGVSRAVLFEIKTSTPLAMAQSSPRGSEAEVKSGDSPVISRGEEGRGNTNERSANHLFFPTRPNIEHSVFIAFRRETSAGPLPAYIGHLSTAIQLVYGLHDDLSCETAAGVILISTVRLWPRTGAMRRVSRARQ